MVADRRACVGNGSVHRQRWCVELGGLSWVALLLGLEAGLISFDLQG